MRRPDHPSRGLLLCAAVMALALAAGCRSTKSEEGAPVDLRVDHPDYYRTIERRINANWGPGRGGAPGEVARGYDRSGGGIVMVSFSIDKDGAIQGTPGVEESSGSAFLDGEAVRAVTSAAPFPPLPEGLGTDRVDLLWRFEHHPGREPSD